MNTQNRKLMGGLKDVLIVAATLLLTHIPAGESAIALASEPQATTQAAARAEPYGHVYSIGKDVSVPIVTKYMEPEFPTPKSGQSPDDDLDRVGGTCEVSLIVDSLGEPHDIRVRRSMRPDFDANAIKAVRQYRFKPAQRFGEPVAVSLTIRVIFERH